MNTLDKYDSMLFNYETVARTDFRDGEIRPTIRTVYKEKPTCLAIRPPPLKYIYTLTEWKDLYIPYHVYKPKEIVRTNPRDVQPFYEEIPDLDRELARETRPRLVMTPAVSMDDVQPAEKRRVLMNDIYSTTTKRAMVEGASSWSNSKGMRAPFPGRPAPANPITLEKIKEPYVSPEWRMETASWDRHQQRAFCNPDKEFYLARTPQCTACDVTAALEMQRKMAEKSKRK